MWGCSHIRGHTDEVNKDRNGESRWAYGGGWLSSYMTDNTVQLLTDEFFTWVIDQWSITGQWPVYNLGSNFVCK